MHKSRIELEKKVVQQMIQIYCNGHRHVQGATCDCQDLMAYAHKKLDLCPMGDEKPFCSKCERHCYQPEMRVNIKAVMRYAGPRILFYNPKVAIQHMLQTRFK